jgi:hypothetical protein
MIEFMEFAVRSGDRDFTVGSSGAHACNAWCSVSTHAILIHLSETMMELTEAARCAAFEAGLRRTFHPYARVVAMTPAPEAPSAPWPGMYPYLATVATRGDG